jgi:ATF/CREB family transcription factor
VAALTSPSSLLPGGGTTPYPWGSSLRTGPLSPAMLSGPTGDYFADSHHLRGGFTPNESSLRTGLTPGGGGSMFPAPSPNSQAIFNQLASGGATPSTLDFHRTALSAARKRNETQSNQNTITSQPQDIPNGIEMKQNQNQPAPSQELFAQHDANDAANGLFMLASQSRNSSQGLNQYVQAPPPSQVHSHPQPPSQHDTRVNGSMSTASGRGVSEMSGHSDESEQARPNTRGKGKKAQPQTNGRRKAEEPPTKTSAKKSKGNSGNANSYMEPEPLSDEEQDMKQDDYHANGKKMTDEEKRKNFLERNR